MHAFIYSFCMSALPLTAFFSWLIPYSNPPVTPSLSDRSQELKLNEKEKKGFYRLVRKEQKIGEKTLLQRFLHHKRFLLSQRVNAQSTNDKMFLSQILLPLFISNKSP